MKEMVDYNKMVDDVVRRIKKTNNGLEKLFIYNRELVPLLIEFGLISFKINVVDLLRSYSNDNIQSQRSEIGDGLIDGRY